MACRNMDKCKAAVEDIQKLEKVDDSRVYPMKLDLASMKSVKDFSSNFKASKYCTPLKDKDIRIK